MLDKEEVKKTLLNKCDNCKLKQCEGCEFTYTDIQNINKYIEELESILDKIKDKLKEDIENDYCIEERIGDAYITIGVKEYSVKPYAREILNILEGEKKK